MWMVGVVLLLLMMGFGFTGYLLPWDQNAYWATPPPVGARKALDLQTAALTQLRTQTLWRPTLHAAPTES